MFRRHQSKGSLTISLPNHNHESKGKQNIIKQSKDKKQFKTPSIPRWSSSLNPIHRDPSNSSSSSSYIIEADFEEDILTISVYHTITTKTWRQQFTQNSFKSHKIYNVSKTLIKSIQATANTSNHTDDEKDTSPSIKIFEHNAFCYVTLLDSDFPSFALRPAPMGSYTTHIRQSKPRNPKWTSSKQKQHKSDSYFDLSPLSGVHSIEGMSSENTMSTVWTQSLTEYHDMDKEVKEPGTTDKGCNKHKAVTNKDSVQYGFV
eukprot:76061_1